MSEMNRDYTEIPTPKNTPEEVLTRKKTRIMDNVAKVVTMLLALLFWLYVFATNDATKVEEKAFDVVAISIDGEDAITSYGLAVQDMSVFNLDVSLKGTRSALSGIDRDDVQAYVDISDVTKPGVYTRTVKYRLPSGVTVVDSMRNEEIEVTVDTVTIKSFTVDASNVYLGNFSLPESCTINTAGIQVKIDNVKLEAPTMLLDQIKSVRIRSTEHLTLETNTKLSAVVEAISADGEVITSSSLKIVTYYKGMVVDLFTVTVPIVQEKSLPVFISEKDGLVDNKNVTASPAYVIVKGDPEVMNTMTKVTLSPFTAKNLVTDDDGKVSFKTSLPALPEGVISITDVDGKTLESDGITVTVQMEKERELTVPKSAIKLFGPNAEIIEDSIKVWVRCTELDFALIQHALDEGKDPITLAATLKILSGEIKVELEVRISPEYAGKVYEVMPNGTPYTVTVRPIS